MSDAARTMALNGIGVPRLCHSEVDHGVEEREHLTAAIAAFHGAGEERVEAHFLFRHGVGVDDLVAFLRKRQTEPLLAGVRMKGILSEEQLVRVFRAHLLLVVEVGVADDLDVVLVSCWPDGRIGEEHGVGRHAGVAPAELDSAHLVVAGGWSATEKVVAEEGLRLQPDVTYPLDLRQVVGICLRDCVKRRLIQNVVHAGTSIR